MTTVNVQNAPTICQNSGRNCMNGKTCSVDRTKSQEKRNKKRKKNLKYAQLFWICFRFIFISLFSANKDANLHQRCSVLLSILRCEMMCLRKEICIYSKGMKHAATGTLNLIRFAIVPLIFFILSVHKHRQSHWQQQQPTNSSIAFRILGISWNKINMSKVLTRLWRGKWKGQHLDFDEKV